MQMNFKNNSVIVLDPGIYVRVPPFDSHRSGHQTTRSNYLFF
jgi:hypothetical protein